MKLKVKSMKLSAGRPVVILNKKLADNKSIHVDERILIKKGKNQIISVVDIEAGMLRQNEIIVSLEVMEKLGLNQNDYVRIETAPKPESVDFINKKLLCKPLTKYEIQKIMSDIVKNALTEAEIAYFISAVHRCGMSIGETTNMIKAIVSTGKKLHLPGTVADKHSIGGIPGRTTPIIVSICSAAGLKIPKTSSRAITSASGTADALEVICQVDFTVQEIKNIIKKTNACIVWGGSLNLAPADDKIIQVERLLNLDSEPQLLASILAKKIAVGAKYILIDLPYGKNAKIKKKEAEILSRKFIKLGKRFNLKLKCSKKEINEPLGNGIGPALEIADVIKILKREDPCHLLESRSLELSAKLLELTGKAKKGEGYNMAERILNSGLAFQKFEQIIKAQKGKLDGIKKAKYHHDIKAEKTFTIKEIKIKELNAIARIAGCPLDKTAGIYLYKHLRDRVKKSETIFTIYSENMSELKNAVNYYKKTRPIR